MKKDSHQIAKATLAGILAIGASLAAGPLMQRLISQRTGKNVQVFPKQA